MRSFRVAISPIVWDELRVIRDRIAVDSPDNAARFVGKLLDAMYGLQDGPDAYRRVARLRTTNAPVHKVVARPYVIYYSVEEPSTVRVLRVIHGHRRQPRRFE